ncbi:MAG TPA: Nramp family divalent metal transporter [Sphingomicrobium sp.]|nr:Nramp family divalent metal transporter [Sphingomicrobium sp.]
MSARSKLGFRRLEKTFVRSLQELGPGLVTGAADDDPSGIATYSQAGAQFGYGLMWTMVLCYPLMSAVQLVSAHIGRVTGSGLASNLVGTFPKRLVGLLIGVLLVANIINIGADLSAMAAAMQLVVGGGQHLFVIAFAIISTALQLFVPYRRYANILKWMTLSLFAYVAVLLVVRTDWAAALRGLVWPEDLGRDALLTIVALLGTTISPYLFFWQSSQEAEEIANSKHRPIREEPRSARRQFRRMRFDTLTGMAFSNLIALAIIMAAAATLNRQGITQIGSAADAAQALRPVAGQFAFGLFALGIIGTGFLAVPVLAGSAAFAVAEVFGWKEGLEYQPQQAAGFYSIIVVSCFIGVLIDWSPIDPMRALFWSAVLNGLAAVPLMIAMMIVVSRHQVMGRFTATRPLLIWGWAATLVMTIASVAMLATSF